MKQLTNGQAQEWSAEAKVNKWISGIAFSLPAEHDIPRHLRPRTRTPRQRATELHLNFSKTALRRGKHRPHRQKMRLANGLGCLG